MREVRNGDLYQGTTIKIGDTLIIGTKSKEANKKESA